MPVAKEQIRQIIAADNLNNMADVYSINLFSSRYRTPSHLSVHTP